ncbi:MAG: glycosyltransferase family 2 protein [Patescibacteria group bacterium]|nr:glycosyltransferase family 2 protein [Patescibacteria group bacterium]
MLKGKMKLSIIIPAYNEEKTIVKVIRSVVLVNIGDVKKEIIVVDDGSNDQTAIKAYKEIKKIKIGKILRHKKNQGKGAALRTGFKHATGDFIIIQDADLEYNPKYLPSLLQPLKEDKSEVVYGTRLKRLPNFTNEEKTVRFFLHYLGNRLLSLFISLLYYQWITDLETGYKIFPRKAIENINFQANSFDFEVEITSRLLKSGYKILEIPIKTSPRGYKEGKKLKTARDGSRAFWAILKYRI